MDRHLLILYCILAYWAAGRTIYKNRVLIGSFKDVFLEKFITGFLLGFILIPIAVISFLFGKR